MQEKDNYDEVVEGNGEGSSEFYDDDSQGEDFDDLLEGLKSFNQSEIDTETDNQLDEEPKAKPSIPIDLAKALNNECLDLKEIFPDYGEDSFSRKLSELADDFDRIYTDYSMKEADGEAYSKTHFLPNQKGILYNAITDKETLDEFYETLDYYEEVLKKMQKEYAKKGSEYQKKLLQVLINNVQIIKSADYLENVEGFSDYYRTSLSGVKNMPGLFFKKDENAFETNPEKFDLMVKEYGLLDQYINTQNFYLNKYLPTKKLRDEDKLIGQNMQTYNHDYREYLSKQQEYLTKNIALTADHPLFMTNKRIIANKEYVKNISGKKSYANERLEDIDFELDLMNRGWPAADMPFLREVKNAQKILDKIVNDEELSPEIKKDAVAAKALMDKSVERLFNSYVTPPSVRSSLLDEFEQVVQPYNQVFRQSYSGNEEVRNKLADVPLIKSYYDTAARNVQMIEIGTNPLLIRKASTIDEKLMKGLSIDELEKNFEFMLKDLKKVDPKTLRSSDQFSDMKTSLINLVNDIKRLKENREYNDPLLDDENTTYAAIFTELGPKIKRTQEYVKTYLEYKKTEFSKDRSRKNERLKQYREQPRVNMAINLYDKLGYISERVNYFADKEQYESLHPNDADAKELNLINLQKRFTQESTDRINARNNYSAYLISRQNVAKKEERTKELKAKKNEVNANNKPKAKTDAKPNIKL